MKNLVIYIVGVGVLILGIWFEVSTTLYKNAILEKAQSTIKLHELRAKQWQDSVIKFKSHIKMLDQEVAILAHENDSLAKKESVIVYRSIHLPSIAYRPGQLDSIWRKRYKIQ